MTKKHCGKCTMTFNVGRQHGQHRTKPAGCPDCGLNFHEIFPNKKDDRTVHVWVDEEESGKLQYGESPKRAPILGQRLIFGPM